MLVRSRFDGDFSGGFDVVRVLDRPEGRTIRVRRRSDGVVLPAEFRADDVMVERRRRSP